MLRNLIILLAIVSAACAEVATTSDTKPQSSPGSSDGGVLHSISDAGENASRAGTEDASTSGTNNTQTDDEDVSSGFVYKPYDINHIGITGQSNSVALSADPITNTQPYSNLAFNTGVMPMTNCDGSGCKTYDKPLSFIPLIEGDVFFWGSKAETLASGFANEVSKLRPEHTSLVSIHGRSGNTYWCLRKGGCNYKPGYLSPFEQGVREIQDAKTIASNSGKSYIVRAIISVHGESDHYSYSLNRSEFPLDGSDGSYRKIKDYSDALIEWQSDYETEAKGITKQTDKIPLFVSQVSGWNDVKESVVAQMQLDAHNRSNGNVVLVTPGYPFEFLSDCKHYTSHSQRQLGEYFAKAYHRVIIEGKRWEPVRPKSIVRNESTIIIRYYVPVPPLVLDTSRIPNPGNYGFEFKDNSNTTITNVVLSGPDTVTITLSKVPDNNSKLTYAQNQIPNTCLGSRGARGNIRDSDNTKSQYGYVLYNWGVLFVTNVN